MSNLTWYYPEASSCICLKKNLGFRAIFLQPPPHLSSKTHIRFPGKRLPREQRVPVPPAPVQEPPEHAQLPWCNAGVSSAPAPSLREGAGAMSHLLFSRLLPPFPPSPELMVAHSFSGSYRPQALKMWVHMPLRRLPGCNAARVFTWAQGCGPTGGGGAQLVSLFLPVSKEKEGGV